MSTEQPADDEDEVSSFLLDMMDDSRIVFPEDSAIPSRVAAPLREAMGLLSEREQDVLRLRFGLEDGNIRTREEVGRVIGVDPERVLQVESKTLALLPRPNAGHHRPRSGPDDFIWEINRDDPEDPGGGSRVREPRRPGPTSGLDAAELPIE